MAQSTPPDETDLRDTFAGIHAPASMRRYQIPPPRPIREGGGRRLQALVAVAAVALAGIVAGTYFGVRGLTTAHSGAGSGIGPSARSFAAMAFDPDRGQVVLFGGADGTAAQLGDTWLWDGSGWTEARPAHSPAAAAYGSAMAWDPQSHRLILVTGPGCGGAGTKPAGLCSPGGSAQLWAWNGRDWSQLDQTDGPAMPVALATDERVGRIVAVSADPSTMVSGGAAGSGSAVPATAAAGITCIGGEKCASIACPLGDPATAGEIPPVGVCGGCRLGPQPASSGPVCVCPATATSLCRPCSASSAALCPRPAPTGAVTWSFDGARFQRVTTATDGPVGAGVQLVWSPAIGRLIGVSRGISPMEALPQIACRQGSVCPPTVRETSWQWEGDHWQTLPAGSGGSSLSLGGSLIGDDSHGTVVAVEPGQTLTGSGAQGQWTIRRPATSPPARLAPAGAAFDARTGQVVIFGGEAMPTSGAQPGVLGDTWTWDGSTWTLRSGSTKPSLSPGQPSVTSPGTCVTAVPAPSRGAPAAGLETPPLDQVCIAPPATPAPNGGAPLTPGSAAGAGPGTSTTPHTVP